MKQVYLLSALLFSFVGFAQLPPLTCGSGSPILIYSQDFEGGFPSDWSNTAFTNPQWNYDTFNTTSSGTGPSGAFSNSGYVYLECSGGVLGDTDTLNGPTVNLMSTVDAARATFAYHMYGADMGSVAFQVSTDGNTWTELWSQSGQQHTSDTSPWTEVEVDLTAYAGSVLQIRFIGTRGNGFTGDVAIDLFQVEACISCVGPTALNTSNITTTSVDLDWTNGGTETMWIVEYGPAGFTPGTGTQVAAGTNPYTLSGLIDNTNYDIYVYADCGGGDTSIPAGPVNIDTDIACPAPTGFSFTYTSNDTAAMTWTPGGLEPAWIIEYGPSGFTPGTGTSSTVTVSPDTTFGLANGEIYDFYIQADCGSGVNNPWTGPITYATPITNDDVCSAIAVPVDGSTTYYSNMGATEQVGEPTNGFHTAWFTFVAPSTGHLEINTCGNDFNNMIAVYSAASCSAFSGFNLQDEATGNPFTTCTGTFDPAGLNMCDLVPGNTYYLVVAGELNGDQGIFPLTLTEIPLISAGTALPQDVCDDVTIYDLFNTITGNETNSGTWYNPSVAPGNEFPNSIDLSATPPGTYPFFYVDQNQCDQDQVETSITIHEMPSVGNGGIINQICDHEDVNLFNGLNGTITIGGIWKDVNGDTIPNGIVNYTGESPGIYSHWYVFDNGGCPADSSIVNVQIINCASLNETAIAMDVYPNPTSDFATVRFKELISIDQIRILDLTGKVLLQESNLQATTSLDVDLSKFEDGVYVLEISVEGHRQSVQLIKY